MKVVLSSDGILDIVPEDQNEFCAMQELMLELCAAEWKCEYVAASGILHVFRES